MSGKQPHIETHVPLPPRRHGYQAVWSKMEIGDSVLYSGLTKDQARSKSAAARAWTRKHDPERHFVERLSQDDGAFTWNIRIWRDK